MVLSLIILIPFVLLTVLFYFKFRPRDIGRNITKGYNVMVIVLALTACFFVALHFYNTTGQSVDKAWWPPLAVLGSMFIFPVVLLVGGFIRNVLLPVILRCMKKK